MSEKEGTILWLDDHIKHFYSEIDGIEEEGFKVLTSANTYEALQLVKDNNIDLIIADLFIPPPDGATFLLLAGEILTTHKFIVMSSYTTNDIYRSQLNKMKDRLIIVPKPMDFDRLLKHVKRTVSDNKKSISENMTNIELLSKRLKELYDSSELKPGLFGLTIDLKKLFSGLKKK